MTAELLYFNVRARAEPLRMLMRHAGVPYTDRLVSLDEWPSLKPSLPAGRGGKVQLPVLRLPSGEMIAESVDIARWAAAHAGAPLLPDATEPPALDAEALWLSVDRGDAPFCCAELPVLARVNPLLNFFDEEQTKEERQAFLRATAGVYEHYGRLLVSTPPPFFGGEQPHYADFVLFHYFNNIETLDGGAVLASLRTDEADAVREWYRAMKALPAVAAYLSERPQPGEGAVGRPVSVIYKHKDPAALFEPKSS
ncbi:hypothetical protein AB1Y20_002712 [Prymnesium parvum]|uniref:Glutathione transferase n=1 Tax=Prymnesium parvum TaxID=97485 RepID=A0AB34J9Y0_PRYPA|mmetsp:Transcript_13757/g.34350  ORF Transcript_13757/g.34350 Transcript_13757/m.34350 type:complete len:253 (-) Transcript_13757:340-1098(-)